MIGYPKCEFCGADVDPRKPGTFRKVTGWAETRSRAGIHGLTDRRELGEYACGPCIKLFRAGVSPAQGGLL